MRQKTSPIWTIPIEQFKEVVENSKSVADILRHFGLVSSGASHRPVHQRAKLEGIELPKYSRIGLPRKDSKSLTASLTENSTIKSAELKKRLFKEGLLKEECGECGQLPVWNNKPLVLQLDHINDTHSDNRLENLRILCPHCHTQTDTFAGRRLRQVKNCSVCGCAITNKSTVCRKCMGVASSLRQRKFNPTKDALEKLVWEKPCAQLAKEWGVADTAIVKRCKKFGIAKPPRGYWQKIKAGSID